MPDTVSNVSPLAHHVPVNTTTVPLVTKDTYCRATCVGPLASTDSSKTDGDVDNVTTAVENVTVLLERIVLLAPAPPDFTSVNVGNNVLTDIDKNTTFVLRSVLLESHTLLETIKLI